ncbi:MAG: hypothetical protein ACP5C3_07015, partial [Methanomicrobiales archaeon]
NPRNLRSRKFHLKQTPCLGIIQMDLTTFNELYTGYAFVLEEEILGAVKLTDDKMSEIKGLWHTIRTMKWRWHPGEWRSYTIVINKKIRYPAIKWSYFPGWKIWTPWGYKTIGARWYPSGITIKYYHLRVKLKIWYYVPGYPEPYVVYERKEDSTDIDKYKYGLTFFAVSASMTTFGAVAETLTLISGGASLSAALPAKTVFGVAAVGYSIFNMFNYTNPDPNPTGAGEGYVNMIDPSWEPFLSK